MTTMGFGNYVKFGKRLSSEDIDYFKENLIPYIEKKSIYHYTVFDGEQFLIGDFETRIRNLVTEYMLENFTVHELELISLGADSNRLTKESIAKNKKNAITSINFYSDLPFEEHERLKRKVWNMNPIVFGLLVDLIKSSDLFHENRDGEQISPIYYFFE